MEKNYNINELAMMSGFTTRTLRNYMNQGLLHGEKIDGMWRFTAEDVDKFFGESFVKEGLKVKRNAMVFDFLTDTTKKTNRACVILDLPVSDDEGDGVSDFFCDKMESASDTVFTYVRDYNMSRIILVGSEDQVVDIMKAYYSAE